MTAPMPTMQEIDRAKEVLTRYNLPHDMPYIETLYTAARRGVEADRFRIEALDIRTFHDACVRDLYQQLGVDGSDGEYRYKWASLELASKLRELAETKAELAALKAAQPDKQPGSTDGYIVCPTPTCDTPNDCLMKGSCRRKAAQPEEYPSSADDEVTRWRHGEPTQPERVSVPREQIEQVQNGIANLITNAETRGDKYDVGYLGAMQKMVDSWLAAAQEGK